MPILEQSWLTIPLGMCVDSSCSEVIWACIVIKLNDTKGTTFEFKLFPKQNSKFTYVAQCSTKAISVVRSFIKKFLVEGSLTSNSNDDCLKFLFPICNNDFTSFIFLLPFITFWIFLVGTVLVDLSKLK